MEHKIGDKVFIKSFKDLCRYGKSTFLPAKLRTVIDIPWSKCYYVTHLKKLSHQCVKIEEVLPNLHVVVSGVINNVKITITIPICFIRGSIKIIKCELTPDERLATWQKRNFRIK